MKQDVDIHYFGDTVCDLHPLSYGHRKCNKGFPRPVEVNSDCYKLHYIASGKGVFEKNGESFQVKGGQVFVSKPGEIFAFKADEVDPFHFIWIRFTGKTAKKLDALPTLNNVSGTPFFDMINGERTEEHVTAQLYLIVSELTDEKENKYDYVPLIKNYVDEHESGNVTVDEIRRHLNFSRQHLSTLFKQKTGISLQQYIISSRIEKSKLLLKKGYTVTEVSELCGYSSVYAFSKAFKKETGVSPTHFVSSR